MLNTGETIDRYTVDSVLGHGGTAVVYLVRHNQLGSQHALKVLSLSSGAIRKRLLREGQLQAALQHANIVNVTDVLDVGGNPGLLMEYIDGPPMDHAMKRYKIGLRDALILFRGIVAGVRAAHNEGLVHRDLKPANILLFRSSEGFVPKVTDFGLAKVVVGRGAELGQTRQGIAMGTPAYMAPEQIRDARAVDQRADLFSLGCILYELATRCRAFPGDQALEIYNNIVAGRYTPAEELVPDLPDAVVQAIDGCLILDRERRIPDCDTLLSVLSGAQVWDVVDHPVPDEVLPTEEVTRDAPAMPIATHAPTPPPAGQRVNQGSAAVPESPSQTFDPDAVEGTLGASDSMVSVEEERPRRRVGLLVGALLGLAALVLLVGVVGLGLGAALGWGRTLNVGASEPSVAVDGTTGAAGRAPAGDVAPLSVGTKPTAGQPPAQALQAADPTRSGGTPAPVTRPIRGEVVDDEPQPGSMSVVARPPTRAVATAQVKLLSQPRTVELEIDGVRVGRTPKKVTLPVGSHRVRVRSGEEDARFRIDVRADGSNTWCYSFASQATSLGKCP
ncbi:MAG: serine/threonine-protein kinase [Myxococcota bacterium]